MRTIAIIPVYNEVKYIEKVITETQKYVDKVLVIDDASEDSTLQILKDLDVEYIHNSVNKGNSYSILKGFKFAIKNNYDTIISIDGDFAHNPNEIPNLIEALNKETYPFVIGNRFKGKSEIPSTKIYANFFATNLFNLITSTKQKDVACGFRAFKKDFLTDFIENNKSIGFQIVYDEILFAIRHKININYVPITVNYDASDLLSTQKNEFINLIDLYINIAFDKRIQEKMSCIKSDINDNISFSIVINNIVICVIAIKENNSFFFQKQNTLFSNGKLKLYNFNEL